MSAQAHETTSRPPGPARPAATPAGPSPTTPRRWPRAVLVAPAGIALLAGLDAALMLLGVPAPVSVTRLPDVHGMLLVLGFVGALISLERSVALGRRLGFAAPLLLGLGALLLLTPLPLFAGKTVQLLGTAAMTAVYVPLWRRQRDDAVLVQALGAVLAVGASALWLGGVDVSATLPWLAGFIVLTIAGERLELARIAMGARAGTILVLLSTTLMAAVAAALLWPAAGYPLLGLVVLVLTCWLALHDVARHTIRTKGLTRYMAAAMLPGYLWLGVAGAVWMLTGAASDGRRYDVAVHGVFLGFTISMIMAHAPVILPAVMRRPLPYRPALLVPLGLLHLGLVVRLWLGDALGLHLAWQVGGVLNVVALLGFVGVAAWSVARGAPPRDRTARPALGRLRAARSAGSRR